MPENHELKFWASLSLIERGEEERGAALLREAIEIHAGWAHMVENLTPQMMPTIEQARALLGVQGPGAAAAGGGSGPT